MGLDTSTNKTLWKDKALNELNLAVLPAASSAAPVFHRYYDTFGQTPNFYRHSAVLPVAVTKDVRSLVTAQR